MLLLDELRVELEGYRKDMKELYTILNIDKAKETGLTPTELDGSIAFNEANMVIVCRKLYKDSLKSEGFLTNEGFANTFYGADPYHERYIAEIVAVYVKE